LEIAAANKDFSIEKGLKWPARWRADLRRYDALKILAQRHVGLTDRNVAYLIQSDPELIAAYGGTPSEETIRRAPGALSTRYHDDEQIGRDPTGGSHFLGKFSPFVLGSVSVRSIVNC
jgi:hypothetical protein